ncbi:hypothetical protein FNU76_23155 [Chitinimonas arctica]|uniref:KfrB domain-containing protein n=1 Tax=Chitinimonas arctica TaxID=2594795 RepID=A0A516SLG8_9NEIS|nr:hypothetical protein [Chitinimonas arctica]QDQ29011.1 hypothetical protein FNU76_23155 [Chitinimonas arctica]
MELTYNAAFNKLCQLVANDEQNIANLTELVKQTSGIVEGAPPNGFHILYSGETPKKERCTDVVKAVGNDPDAVHVIHVGRSEVGKLCNNELFRGALQKAIVRDVLGDRRPQAGDFPALNRRMQEVRNGRNGTVDSSPRFEQPDNAIWDIASRKYVEAAQGDFRVLAPGPIDPLSVFTKSELPALLNNERVGLVDGMSRTGLANILDRSDSVQEGMAVLNAVFSANSLHQVNLTGIAITDFRDYLDLSADRLQDGFKAHTQQDLAALKETCLSEKKGRLFSTQERPASDPAQGYSGRIVAASPLHVVQEIGANCLVAHQKFKLGSPVQIGAKAQIAYDREGAKVLQDQKKQQQSRSATR